ncbi:hypothetical protein [Emticicia sp. SJ17W-69]|uniref:hypothetical protein n=1 Tax=Emticicia sp. SJ17W-69 TaxID=3421657 RepID=UPI003EB90132
MKKKLLLKVMTLLSLIFLLSCEEDDLINGGSRSSSNPITPTTGTTPNSTKCYIKDVLEVIDGDKYKSSFTFNTKNLLEKIDNDGAITTYTYDAANHITGISIIDGSAKETFTYTYDAKGNISNVKYDSKDAPYDILLKEYIFTTNASGQVSKVTAISSISKDANVEYLFEYDTKGNLKKLNLNTGGTIETIIENLTFDDKPNVYANAGLNKVYIPLIIIGAFFGENLSHFINTNNILTDKSISFFSAESATTTYKYEYTKEGQPSKKTYVTLSGVSTINGSETYSYLCN